jgi:hypothetical protein
VIWFSASLVVLAVGPLAFTAAYRRSHRAVWLERAVLAAITALVVLELAEGVRETGLILIPVMAGAGLFGPTAIESLLHRVHYHAVEARAHLATLVLGILGLVTHAMLDGAALAEGTASHGLLPVAIVLHRVPVSMTVWWLLRGSSGRKWSWAALLAIAASTTIGYTSGPGFLETWPPTATAAFGALVAGSLLHVVFFRGHAERH